MKDFPLFRSVPAGMIGLGAMTVPLILLSLSSASAPLAVMIVIMLLPVAACICGLVCGAAPMMAGVLSGIFSLYCIAGTEGAQAAAVYLLPVMIAFFVVIIRRIPFWKGCAVMIGVHVAALAGCYLMIQSFVGGALFTRAGEAAAEYIAAAEGGDYLLYAAYQNGLISLTEEMKGSLLVPQGGGFVLGDAARQDLLLSVRGFVNSLLVTLVPSLMVGQSILGGVGCLALSLRWGSTAAQRRDYRQVIDDQKELQAPDFPDLGMIPVSLWHIPRGIGWKVGLCWMIGSVMQAGATAPLAIGGMILYAAANAVFTLQGIAFINFLQKAKGAKKGWRIALPILLYMLSALPILGVLDQITNIRGLRPPRQPKEE